MPSILDIFRSLGSVPRRVGDALYDEEPIYEEGVQRRRVNIPGLDGESQAWEGDVPTGERQQVGTRRTPTKLGQALPQILRGAVVGAASPKRGEVGTAGDFFGSILAAQDDQEARGDKQYQRGREVRQDRMTDDLHGARMDDYRAQAEYNRSRARAEDIKAAAPPKRGEFVEFAAQVKEVNPGATFEQIIALYTKQALPGQKQIPPPTNIEGFFARKIAEAQTPEERQQLLDEYAKHRKSALPPRVQIRENREGEYVGIDTSKPGPTGVKVPVKKSAVPRPRTQVRVGEGNEYQVIDLDKPGPTGIKAPETKKAAVPSFDELFGGGQKQGAAAPKPAVPSKKTYKFTQKYQGHTYGRNSEKEPWTRID